jgi:Ca2+-binding EF-hand superfamily protein
MVFGLPHTIAPLLIHMQPAKRRAPAAADAVPSKARRSALAKEHNITGEEENEIKEAFRLFAQDHKGEKEGVIPIGDVRRAMMYARNPPCPSCCQAFFLLNTDRRKSALDISPTTAELAEFTSILDPDEDGYAIYSSFVAICALKLHNRTKNSDTHRQEVEDAFKLFTRAGEERITLATLKRVAQALKEDVEEDVLRDMILEANGGAGVGRGVERDEFEAVLRRAGVWR